MICFFVVAALRIYISEAVYSCLCSSAVNSAVRTQTHTVSVKYTVHLYICWNSTHKIWLSISYSDSAIQTVYTVRPGPGSTPIQIILYIILLCSVHYECVSLVLAVYVCLPDFIFAVDHCSLFISLYNIWCNLFSLDG